MEVNKRYSYSTIINAEIVTKLTNNLIEAKENCIKNYVIDTYLLKKINI